MVEGTLAGSRQLFPRVLFTGGNFIPPTPGSPKEQLPGSCPLRGPLLEGGRGPGEVHRTLLYRQAPRQCNLRQAGSTRRQLHSAVSRSGYKWQLHVLRLLQQHAAEGRAEGEAAKHARPQPPTPPTPPHTYPRVCERHHVLEVAVRLFHVVTARYLQGRCEEAVRWFTRVRLAC